MSGFYNLRKTSWKAHALLSKTHNGQVKTDINVYTPTNPLTSQFCP